MSDDVLWLVGDPDGIVAVHGQTPNSKLGLDVSEGEGRGLERDSIYLLGLRLLVGLA